MILDENVSVALSQCLENVSFSLNFSSNTYPDEQYFQVKYFFVILKFHILIVNCFRSFSLTTFNSPCDVTYVLSLLNLCGIDIGSSCRHSPNMSGNRSYLVHNIFSFLE